jgi:hypothetical protein
MGRTNDKLIIKPSMIIKPKYSHYLELRKDRRVHQQKAYDEQQRMIAETLNF